jgi:DNA segregation ATPase FtsK/SpoIIIE-like protein
MPDLDKFTRKLPKSQPLSQDVLEQDAVSQPALFAEIEQMKVKDARDELFDEAIEIVKNNGRGSVSLLQRKLRIGYSRASRLVDQLEEAGILGADQGGNQGRPVLVGNEEVKQQQPNTSGGPPPRIIGGVEHDDPEPPARPRVWM